MVSKNQTGAALVVALTFLVALTIMGLASMGNNSLQLKMAYSSGESNLAFQGSESGIANGELWLEGQVFQPVPDCPLSDPDSCGDSTSIWPARPAAGTPEVNTSNLFSHNWWLVQGRPFGWTYNSLGAPAAISGQEYQIGGSAVAVSSSSYPRYVIEELGKDPTGSLVIGGARQYTLWYYQVSGRGGGYQTNSQAISQSVYTKGF